MANFATVLRNSAIAALVVMIAGIASLMANPASAKVTNADKKAVAQISQHFSSVPSMAGEFIQFGPNGEQTGGKFYLQRPGKIRFDYANPSPITVKADGKTVGINNKKLKTWDFFPLRKTPLRLLLSDKIDVNDKSIKSVKREKDLTTVMLANKSVFGNSKITMMFDPETSDLRQWTITDDQGKDTSVMIFNVQKNVKLSKRLFYMNQREILQRMQNSNDR
ncbi:outer-membrane lipoprotein carrier protein LolA [Ahrensia sp. R2A130]|uniref:outer-membrane lipoprotein carrier protein LolA n=1 Tax=Ahrensia sp. R2A130 TaxID=744979 RepID=UPI0001E0A4F2|nr:outer membrane lipoprotein carrier protein LolA [Ahrensia sp. R2A130]EFL88255.1 outer membrane lipoprotein carrier protein LolA [Ahrensia sp. R2A130]